MTKQTIETRGNNPTLADIIPTPTHKRLWQSYWNSPESLASYVESLDQTKSWHQGAWTNTKSFTGTSSMATAIKLCRNGWPEGAERAARLRDQITAANPIGPRLVKWDIAGAYPSIPRALSGNPLNMRRLDSARLRRKPILTLLSDMCANASTAADAITNRAAVVAAVIDAIEEAGFACEVITFEHGQRDTLGEIVAATVKESHAPSDIGRLAFSLGHASFFRRLTWAAFTCDAFTADLGHGLGSRAYIDQKRANELGAYIVPSANDNSYAFASEETAAINGLAVILASLREQGCPAFVDNQQAA